jgi:putative inorganic carbon (HCO3(-)) transporter
LNTGPYTDRTVFDRLMFACLIGLVLSLPTSVAGMGIFLGAGIVLSFWDMVRRPSLGWKRTPLNEPIFLFLGVTTLSALFGVNSVMSISQLNTMWAFTIFYLFVWYSPPAERIKILIVTYCAMGGLVSILAILQHFTGIPLFGLTPSRLLVSLSGDTVRYIAQGTFSHHQTFANVYLMIFCMAFSIAVSLAPAPKRLVMAVISAALALGVIFSYTRGIWLASLAAVITIGFYRNRKVLAVVCLVAAILGLLLVTVPSTYSNRARSIFTLDSNLDRLTIWRISWAMFQDYPALGIGLGNYPDLQEEYLPETPGLRISRAHAHNSYLQIALERGFFAVVAFMWLWYVVFRVGFSSLNLLRGQEGFRLAVLRGAMAGVIGFLVDGFFQNNFGDDEVIFNLLFLVALIIALRVKRHELENGTIREASAYAAPSG